MKLNKPYEKQAYIDFIAWCNNNNCHFEDKGDCLESIENQPYTPTPKELAEQQISQLKQYLDSTDYVVIKIYEGVATQRQYSDVLEKRKKAREEINQLEQSLLEEE